MFERFMTPLDRHFDDGLGATGQAFKDAADLLAQQHEGQLAFINGHLPICYLYRHSVELFLKSALMIIHRALKLPTAGGVHEKEPKVLDAGKWKPLHQTHSVGMLYAAFQSMVLSNVDKINAIATTDWSQFPVELGGWISEIEKADAKSTYFRYPATKSPVGDVKKSGFQAVGLAEMASHLDAKDEPGEVFLAVKGDDGALVEAFRFEGNPLPDVRRALEEAAGMLSGVSLGLYSQLVGDGVRGV
ncbi:hypothetical protein WMF27_30190 [Sorangium sp. So ce281]|uniref:hypothetical protein n=1 Tax=unclassified Sorangium TaxID=2621164 RepID=UPI003F61AC3A